ncbi:MAG: hypothetical protein JO307_31690 [Bryobacterales bacterium]|nr:hypothetical protein [Bryobacterales bacterium]MBV9398914.1 hypothetical protein [Bryobacterales bacterium]
MGRFIFFTMVVSGVLLMPEMRAQDLQRTHTDRLDFPAGGTLRMPKCIGDVTVEGWDEPVLEITTVKSIKVRGDKTPGIDPKKLDRIEVTPERKGNDVIVRTKFPKFNVLVRPFTGLSDFELEYRIKAPRTAALEIGNQIGEVHINEMTGDIHATDRMGQITVQVVPGSRYSVDARSKLGSIYSDVSGREKKRLKFGHTFITEASGAKTLYLRIGLGDITIFDTPAPVQQ